MTLHAIFSYTVQRIYSRATSQVNRKAMMYMGTNSKDCSGCTHCDVSILEPQK